MTTDSFPLFYARAKQALGIDYHTNEFLYPTNPPWPEPSFDFPYGTAPEVPNIPPEEQADWATYVGSYYTNNALGTADHPTPFGVAGAEFAKAAFMKNGISGYADVDDETFVHLLCEGLYSKFLCRLDPADLTLFQLDPDPDYDYFKSDYACMGVVRKCWPNEHAAPTKVLLRRRKDGPRYADEGAWELLAIALATRDQQDPDSQYSFVPDMVFTGEEHSSHSSWWLLKYFVLQGAIHRINLVDHPRVHFPTDCVNAISKSVLPRWHLLHQLLMPHFWLHLPVDNTVLEGQRSLINRNTWYPWSPFVARGDEVRKLLPYSFAGQAYWSDEPNSSYPRYYFSLDPDSVPDPADPEHQRIPTFIGMGVSRYGAFLREYFEPILAFTRDVVAQMPPPPADPEQHADAEWLEVQHWAWNIGQFLPGFPDRSAICDPDVLARSLAMIIWNDAVCHSGDHGCLHKMMDDHPVPFVLRVPPPKTTDTTVEESLKDALGPEAFAYLKDGVHQIFNMLEKAFEKGSWGPVKKVIADLVEHGLDNVLDDMTLHPGTIPLCWPTDLVYAKMADLLFYRPHNCSLLYDCPYDFLVPEADWSKDRQKLEEQWRALDRPVVTKEQRAALAAARQRFQGLLDQVNLKYYKPDGSPVVPSPFEDKDTAAQLNKFGFPKLRPGTAEESDPDVRAAVRQQACIGAGVQY